MSIRSSSIFCIAYIKHQTSNLKLQIQDSELETGFFVRVVQFGALPAKNSPPGTLDRFGGFTVPAADDPWPFHHILEIQPAR